MVHPEIRWHLAPLQSCPGLPASKVSLSRYNNCGHPELEGSRGE